MKVIPETYLMKVIPETYLMKVIPETHRTHYIRYLCFIHCYWSFETERTSKYVH